jgi:flavin reductase (DIM6/NTAB) family NADH-FMN oxidoreductase RutF
MRLLPGGVAVITAGRAPHRTGYTGTAVFSLSVDPERVVISVGRDSSSFAPIRELGDFGLNFLNGDAAAIADRFAGRGGVKGEARYFGASWLITPRGVSLLEGAPAALECRVEEIVERHSHAIVIAEPTFIAVHPGADALLHWNAQYSVAPPAQRVAAA